MRMRIVFTSSVNSRHHKKYRRLILFSVFIVIALWPAFSYAFPVEGEEKAVGTQGKKNETSDFTTSVTSAAPAVFETVAALSYTKSDSFWSRNTPDIEGDATAGAGTELSGLTEYPVFASATDNIDTQTASAEIDTESVTEAYSFVENQEEDTQEKVDYEASTMSSAIVQSTEPMRSPKSSREQEEVLRELKKLWDLSEGLVEDGTIDTGLKSSLSSIVHLAYARVYSESDQTLSKLSRLLKELQARLLLGSGANDERISTQENTAKSFNMPNYEPNYFTTKNFMTTISPAGNNKGNAAASASIPSRRKRSYYDGLSEDIESIFFANANSQENSVLSDEKNYESITITPETLGLDNYERIPQLNQSNEGVNNDKTNEMASAHLKNASFNEIANDYDKVETEMMTAQEGSDNGGDVSEERKLLQKKVGSLSSLSSSSSSSSTTILSVSSPVPSTTPLNNLVKKVIHINDRRKPMPSFYLTPERIQELKNRMTSTTLAPQGVNSLPGMTGFPTSPPTTLSPLVIPIQDELENEVNSLQQQGQVDNYDVHISNHLQNHYQRPSPPPPASFYPPLVSTTISPVFNENEIKRPSTPLPPPYSTDDIAMALFQLLKPETVPSYSHENNEVTSRPDLRPPSPTHIYPNGLNSNNVLFQVGQLNSILNFTISKKPEKATTVATTTTTTTSTTPPTTSTTTTTEATTTTPPITTLSPTLLSILKLKDSFLKKNDTFVLDIPSEFSNLGATTMRSRPIFSSTTEKVIYAGNDVYEYEEEEPTPKPLGDSILDGLKVTVQQMTEAITRLSIGAKAVLLFSICISILSIGFGLYALGPPLAGMGFLGLIIPVGLLLLVEGVSSPSTNNAGRRKLTKGEAEELLKRVQSDDFSLILESILSAVAKYGEG